MVRHAYVKGLAAAAIVACAAPVRAATVTFVFTGVVTTLVRDGGLFGAPGAVQLEDPFTGHITYEIGAANPDLVPADPEVGSYVLLEFVIDQSVLPPLGMNGIVVQHVEGGPVLPPSPPDLGRDRFFARATSEVYPSVLLRLQGPFESAFTDDSLPALLDLADFPDVVAVQGLVAFGLPPNPNTEDVGVITSLEPVPEPGAAWLGAACIASLGGIACRRRVAACAC